MELENRSPFPALAYVIEDPNGVEADVVVARSTFVLSKVGAKGRRGEAALSHELVALDVQPELVLTDQYFGEVNASSVRQESDLAQQKPRCDLIVIASAHSPTGEAVARVEVAVRVERPEALPGVEGEGTLLENRLVVHGARRFVKGEAHRDARCEGPVEDGWQMTEAEPFTEQAIRYEHAFGGELRVYTSDEAADRVGGEHRLSDEARAKHPQGEGAPIAHTACVFNPVGAGFLEGWYEEAAAPDQWPAPQVESPEAPFTVKEWRAVVRGDRKAGDTAALTPRGIGVITKAWQPRLALAGTFDERWREEKWPLMPDDFQMAYWNGAHADMQCPRLFAGDVVTLENMAPPGDGLAEEGRTVVRFALPDVPLSACLFAPWVQGGWVRLATDTVIVDMERGLVSLVWRLHLPAEMQVAEAVLAVPEVGEGAGGGAGEGEGAGAGAGAKQEGPGAPGGEPTNRGAEE